MTPQQLSNVVAFYLGQQRPQATLEFMEGKQ